MNTTGATALRIAYVNVSGVDTNNLATTLVHSINDLFAGLPEPDAFIAAFSPDLFPSMDYT
jgi:hypothetical protein